MVHPYMFTVLKIIANMMLQENVFSI